jgi:hypothetical protein
MREHSAADGFQFVQGHIVRYQTVAGDEVSRVRNVTERYGPAILCHIAAVSRCEASNSVGTAVGRFHIAVLCECLCMYII